MLIYHSEGERLVCLLPRVKNIKELVHLPPCLSKLPFRNRKVNSAMCRSHPRFWLGLLQDEGIIDRFGFEVPQIQRVSLCIFF